MDKASRRQLPPTEPPGPTPEEIEVEPVLAADLWARRRDVVLVILGWLALITVAGILISKFAHIVTVLVLSALLAYLVFPLVSALQKSMPRVVAMTVVYVAAIGIVGLVGYLAIRTAASQVPILTEHVHGLLAPSSSHEPPPLVAALNRVGIRNDQIAEARQQIVGHTEQFAAHVLPVLRGLLDSVLDVVLVIVLSAYLLVDGEHVGRILRSNTPRSHLRHMELLLGTTRTIVGGYIRGQLVLSTTIGLLVGLGMALFRVPAASLLGVLAFLLAFVPILGTLVSGALCILLALTRGWLIAVLVLGYFVLVHVIEGDVLGPRIVGKALGIHPVVSILAVIAGAELFGIKGALFAAPVVGFVQALVSALWAEWKQSHPEEFSENAIIPAVSGE